MDQADQHTHLVLDHTLSTETTELVMLNFRGKLSAFALKNKSGKMKISTLSCLLECLTAIRREVLATAYNSGPLNIKL